MKRRLLKVLWGFSAVGMVVGMTVGLLAGDEGIVHGAFRSGMAGLVAAPTIAWWLG